MAAKDQSQQLSTPLLSNNGAHSILTIHEEEEEEEEPSSVNANTNTQDSENPYGFLGAHGFELPGPTTVDPFKNETPNVDGLYEWVKILVLLPIALLRLVLFGLCLMVGYVATLCALQGWGDKQNPMPKWRCRVMWVTRFCSRGILFSFGYHWIRRKGRPAPRQIAPIVVSNHVSYIEPIFFFYELFPTTVASESHDSMPVVGTIIRAMQVIYVNRFSQSSRKHAVNEIKLFETDVCFRGSEYRERLLAINFLEFFYFPRERQQMEELLFLSNLVLLSLVILSSQ